MVIWQQPSWPLFQYDAKLIDSRLVEVLALQQQLVASADGLPEDLDRQAELDSLVQSAIKSAEIEGESLNVGSVRSSVARQLGLEQAGLPKASRYEDSVVEMLVAAVSDLELPLTNKLLCQWQAALFLEPPLLGNIAIGSFRDDAEGPMEVVSQRRGRTEVHFEAPPAKRLAKELKSFYTTYNGTSAVQDGVIRAAIAHLHFITLHPFDDGNGRVARALTDRALALCENSSVRFYSLSAAIEKNKDGYYQILEETQNCRTKRQQHEPLDTTDWVLWFLDTLGQAIADGLLRVERVLLKALFWQRHAQTLLSERQLKVLNRLLDGYGLEFVDGLAARHYQAIGGGSKATATRDLADLVQKGCLQPLEAGGRSARYRIHQGKVDRKDEGF